MCGIVGSLSTRFDIKRAMRKIKHRGPDSEGVFENSHIQFGHLRLAIIDLNPCSNQPFIDESIASVLIFNGEIYNYKYLRKTLEQFYSFRTQSDTEVLYYGLVHYGIDFVNQLRGMFAFAFYDSKRNCSYLVRDRFGIKPLYYKEINEGLIFASEIKSIRSVSFSKDDVNTDRLLDFINNRRQDNTNETFFKGIYQIPASHYLVYDHGAFKNKIVQYYELPSYGSGKRKLKLDELKSELVSAVKLHLQADVEVAGFLSGGIDSSIISHIMSEFAADNLYTLSGRTVYDHPENKLIDVFLKDHPNVKSIQFELDGNQLDTEIFNVIYYHDEPILDGSMFSHYMLCKEAKKHGIKVVLSGAGGDEVFGGYESHMIGNLTSLIISLNWNSFFRNFKMYSSFHNQNPLKVLGKIIIEAMNFSSMNRLKEIRNNNSLLKIKNKKFKFKIKFNNPMNRAFQMNFKHYTVPPYLHYEDRNSMAFGVEIRVPFLDHELVEYFAGLDSRETFNGQTKSSLRMSFQNELNSRILFQSKKEGFPSPLDTALRSDDFLKSFFYTNLATTPFLNSNSCRRLADEFYETGAKLTQFWRVLSYIIWFNVQTKISE